MADYHAVLNRTLSGFSDPKPQLRTKLYERARATIRRQLEGRNPPLSETALNNELDKLELAIAKIEQRYDPEYQAPVSNTAEEAVVESDQQTGEHPSGLALPEDAAVPPAVAAPTEDVAVATEAVDAAAEAVDALPEVEDPVAELVEMAPLDPEPSHEPEPESVAPAIDPAQVEDVVSESTDEVLDELAIAPSPAEPEPEPEPVAMEPSQEPVSEVVADEAAGVEFDPDDFARAMEPVAETAPPSLPEMAEEPPVQASAIETPAPVEPQPAGLPQADPMEQWAKDFLNPPAHDDQAVETPTIPPANETASAPAQADPIFQQYDPAFGEPDEPAPAIPPAPGFGERKRPERRRRGFGKWLLYIILLAALAGAAYFGWTNRQELLDRTGLAELIDDPTRPKPVKTISIKPDPETPDDGGEQPRVEIEPKSENRLVTGDGTTTPTTTQPVVVAPSTQTGDGSANLPSGNGADSQRAILYEEGSTQAENSIDAGQVVWSVVENEPSPGAAKEPAIQARVEIPDRKMVLLMTIKRNSDAALPASHLIELVFAVPDDFSGGAIGQINRFVLKDSEQGRGDGLVAVPARIDDGIFLIALNNLEQAVTANEQLLQSRSWIDIPLQYRTGRRALVTIEKGAAGEKIFTDVFDAWKAL